MCAGKEFQVECADAEKAGEEKLLVVPGLKNDVQLVTQFPQSRRQALDVLSAAESVLPISDSEVTRGPMARPATLNSSATSSSNSTDFSSSSSSTRWSGKEISTGRTQGSGWNWVNSQQLHEIIRLY